MGNEIDAREQAAIALEQTVERLLETDRALFGFDASHKPALLPSLVQPGVQDFRFADILKYTGDPHFLDTPRRILDIGSGTAPFVYSALERGHDAYGIDNDEVKLDIARLKVDAQGMPQHWKERTGFGDAGRLDFPDEHFEVVTSFQVLEHLENLGAALFEAVRVTRRGGWLVLRAPDYRMSFEPHYRIPWPQFAPPWLAELWVAEMGRPPGGIKTFFYITLDQVASQLAALGCAFAVAKLQVAGGFQYADIDAPLTYERMLIREPEHVKQWVAALKETETQGRLDPVYSTELNFIIAARRY